MNEGYHLEYKESFFGDFQACSNHLRAEGAVRAILHVKQEGTKTRGGTSKGNHFVILKRANEDTYILDSIDDSTILQR